MRTCALLLLLSLLLCGLPACGNTQQTPTTEVVVFAAASLTQPLTRLGKDYMAEHPHVTLRFNFDSSGTLLTQIREGAVCDLFLSAGQKQMDALDSSETDQMIRRETRTYLLENTVVLAVPPGNPGNIHSFSQLKERLEQGDLLLAMGGGDTPVGQYGEQVLAALGLSGKQLEHSGCVTYGSNVKEMVVQLSEGTVDCGLIYATDALAAGLTVADTADAEMCGRVVYPAALLTDAPQPEGAQDFLDYIAGEAGAEAFAAAGFLPL